MEEMVTQSLLILSSELLCTELCNRQTVCSGEPGGGAKCEVISMGCWPA